MGIKNLTSFLTNTCPSSIKQIQLNELFGKKAAIDVSIFLYRFKYKGNKLIPKFLEQINRLRINGITPVYIFDGAPSIEKEDTMKIRKSKKEDKYDKISILEKEKEKTNDIQLINGINQQIQDLNNKIISVNKNDIIMVKQLFDLLNIKYYQAQGEADLLCSKLCTENIVDLVISEDMDLLTSGTKLLLRDFNIYNNKATLYDLNEILTKLDISYEQWVELCILFGCDYLKRINGIGPKKSYKLIKSHNSIDNIINELKGNTKISIENDYIKKFNSSKSIFMNYNIDYLDKSNLNICIEPLFDNQLSNIKKFLNDYTTLSNKQIDNRLKNIYKKDYLNN